MDCVAVYLVGAVDFELLLALCGAGIEEGVVCDFGQDGFAGSVDVRADVVGIFAG